MVAGDRQIVARLVHDLHDGGALGQGADGAALDGIASVNQGDAGGAVRRLHLRLVSGDTGVADAGDGVVLRDLVDTAVDVVGVQDHDLSGVVLRRGGVLRCRRGDRQPEGHDHRKQQCQESVLFFHLLTFPSFFWLESPGAPGLPASLLLHYTKNFPIFKPLF